MNEQKNNSNIDNLLIAIFASVLAPLTSRLIHLYITDEQGIWTTENILIVYLSSVIGFIISDKVYRIVNENGLYERGIKLGDADAIRFAIWFIPVILSLKLKSRLAVIVLIALTLISVVILIKDRNQIKISLFQLCLIAVITIVALFLGIMKIDAKMVCWYFIGVIIAAAVVDIVGAAVRRRKR